MKKQSKKSFLFLLLIVPFILNAQVWEYKDSGTDFILLDLSIPPGQDQIAYAAGSQYTVDSEGIIIKTVDGGETWETIYPLSGTVHWFKKAGQKQQTPHKHRRHTHHTHGSHYKSVA